MKASRVGSVCRFPALSVTRVYGRVMALWIVWAVLVLAALVSGVITSPVVLFGLVAGFAVLWRVMERR